MQKEQSKFIKKQSNQLLDKCILQVDVEIMEMQKKVYEKQKDINVYEMRSETQERKEEVDKRYKANRTVMNGKAVYQSHNIRSTKIYQRDDKFFRQSNAFFFVGEVQNPHGPPLPG